MSLIEIREQTSVVIEHRAHRDRLHRIRVEQNTKISVMPIRVVGQRIQYAHTPERIATAKLLEIAEHSRNCAILSKDACRLGQAKVFVGKQLAFTDQFSTVEIQVIIHIARANMCCQLSGQELRQGFDFLAAAAGLVQIDTVLFPDPALSIVAVRTKLR